MVRLRESTPKTACLLALVGATLLPCSSSAFSATGLLNFAAPPPQFATASIMSASRQAATCHLSQHLGQHGKHPQVLSGAFTGSFGAGRKGAILRRSGAMRTTAVLSMVGIEPIEEMPDYRDDDLSGRRLFVTGLPSSIDDVRLYLAFEGFGRVVEARVAKPGIYYTYIICYMYNISHTSII